MPRRARALRLCPRGARGGGLISDPHLRRRTMSRKEMRKTASSGAASAAPAKPRRVARHQARSHRGSSRRARRGTLDPPRRLRTPPLVGGTEETPQGEADPAWRARERPGRHSRRRSTRRGGGHLLGVRSARGLNEGRRRRGAATSSMARVAPARPRATRARLARRAARGSSVAARRHRRRDSARTLELEGAASGVHVHG